MKKCVLLLVFAFILFAVNAQTKNGTVFSEHETIDKTKAMWTAFQNGDQDAFVSFFADSVFRIINGEPKKISNEYFKGAVEFWDEAYENLEIKDALPASPDAIEYKEGGTWVQDWLSFSGTHTKSGININVHYHNIYRFNDAGKIDVIYFYFNNDVFEEIKNSQSTKENGKVYINHPYIVKVRKVLNAFSANDVETWASFFNPKARFWFSTMQAGEFKTFEETKARLAKQFETQGEVKFKQEGYPDCVYYAKSDSYAVYSWWTYKTMKDGKKLQFPIMFTHNFDKEGKINYVFVYYSSNHWDE